MFPLRCLSGNPIEIVLVDDRIKSHFTKPIARNNNKNCCSTSSSTIVDSKLKPVLDRWDSCPTIRNVQSSSGISLPRRKPSIELYNSSEDLQTNNDCVVYRPVDDQVDEDDDDLELPSLCPMKLPCRTKRRNIRRCSEQSNAASTSWTEIKNQPRSYNCSI